MSGRSHRTFRIVKATYIETLPQDKTNKRFSENRTVSRLLHIQGTVGYIAFSPANKTGTLKSAFSLMLLGGLNFLAGNSQSK